MANIDTYTYTHTHTHTHINTQHSVTSLAVDSIMGPDRIVFFSQLTASVLGQTASEQWAPSS